MDWPWWAYGGAALVGALLIGFGVNVIDVAWEERWGEPRPRDAFYWLGRPFKWLVSLVFGTFVAVYGVATAGFFLVLAGIALAMAIGVIALAGGALGLWSPDESDSPAASHRSCDSNYSGACLDPNASDYDCAGGDGDGPRYVGRVRVVGDDTFGLDRDGNGLGCEDS